MSIPKKYKDRIAKHCEKLGKSPKEMEKQLEDLFKFLSSNAKGLSESKLWALSYSRWFGALRRETGSIFSPAPTWTGIIFGDSGLMDFIEIMKRKAEYLYKNPETKQKALTDMLVDRNGVPLDPREKVNYGRDENPNYGRPFPEDEHSYYRALYGVCSRGTEFTDIQFFRLNINDESAVEVEYPVRTTVQFRANPKRKPKYGFLDLNAISNKDLQVISVASDIPDIIDALDMTTWRTYSIGDLSTLYGMHKNDRSVPVLLFANVATINPEVNDKTGNRTLWIDDADLESFDTPGVALFIKGDVPLNFGLDSKVLFVGKPSKIGSGEDERFIFDAKGYYAPFEYLIPME